MSDTTQYIYNDAGLLASWERLSRNTELDPETQLPLFADQTTTTIYSHDDLGRIVRASATTSNEMQDNVVTEDFRYDEAGNMVEQTTDFGSSLSRRIYEYQPAEAPVFNLWQRRFRFFPP